MHFIPFSALASAKNALVKRPPSHVHFIPFRELIFLLKALAKVPLMELRLTWYPVCVAAVCAGDHPQPEVPVHGVRAGGPRGVGGAGGVGGGCSCLLSLRVTRGLLLLLLLSTAAAAAAAAALLWLAVHDRLRGGKGSFINSCW